MLVTHLCVCTPNRFGGHIYDTLCGLSGKTADGFRNGEPDMSEVTCKLCQRIAADPKHWRHRKYLK